MTDLNTIPSIPLNKLVQFEGNVRKVQNKGFIDELAANIKANGLQQNLIVRKCGTKFEVVGGAQRHKALLRLLKQGDIKANYPVPCKIADGAIDPVELSLLENVMREDMHPADAFEAYRVLVDKGIPVADIAARFSKAESYLRQLLKLARVSPALLKAYRKGDLTLEQVMAFAISDDHAAQELVFRNLSKYNRDAHTIRDALTKDEVCATDKRVKFVTLAAYEKADGKVRRDLFSDSVYVLDAGLLNTLVTAKLERAAKAVLKEGWKWVEVAADFGYEQKGKFKRVFAQPAPLPDTLAAKVESLDAEREALLEQWGAAEDDSEQPDRIGEIEEKLEEINAERGEDIWTPEQLAIAGVVVNIGYNGKTEIERGFVRPEDMPKKAAAGKTASAEGAEDSQASSLSAALVESLTGHKSAALSAALQERPDIALAAVVHTMASGIFGHRETSLQLTAATQSLQLVEGSKAYTQLEAAHAAWGRKLPASTEELWQWCLDQKQQTLLELLAFCAASSVNAVQGKSDRLDTPRLVHADMLAVAVSLDMKDWFTPDAENYFSRVSKPQILGDLQEANGQPPAPAWEKLKKADLAKEAERQIIGKAWLPALLRPAA